MSLKPKPNRALEAPAASHGTAAAAGRRASPLRASATLLALGVVFGDIGTSPMYTTQTVFDPTDPHPVSVTRAHVYGVTSLIFWAVMLIVTVTYVLLVMRADNEGEGGIMALITLVSGGDERRGRRVALALAALGIFGASLFLGDSMITPAISVLSAVGGIQVAEPSMGSAVVPITVAIVVVLFVMQRLGTNSVGKLFGPVMVIWFVTIGVAGIHGITDHPEILKALSPTYAIEMFTHRFLTGFFALAAVVLGVTGAEALYADMGHFGRPAIIRGWLGLVFPACVLSYFGQGALILAHPSTVRNPFFLMVPSWAQWPLIIIATAATVIASQAVITGAFSVASQAVQLGYLPRLRIVHTSDETFGQVYVPWINWLLMISVLTLVITFKTSAALAFAFGMAVTGTITITTLLFFYVARHQWGTPRWRVLFGAVPLLTVDLLFLAANATKIVHGAWLPLLIAITVFTLLTTWQRGRQLVTEIRESDEGPLDAVIQELHERHPPIQRVPGTAVFLNRGRLTTPFAMRACIERIHALNEHVVILSVVTESVPYIPAEERLQLDDLGYSDDGIIHAQARFGYMDTPDVPAVIEALAAMETETLIDPANASYFLSTLDLEHGNDPRMSRWRKSLFLATAELTTDAASYFRLPRERTVVMGARIEF